MSLVWILCVCMGTQVPQHLCMLCCVWVRGQLKGFVSPATVGLRDSIWVVRFSGRCPYLLSRLAGPSVLRVWPGGQLSLASVHWPQLLYPYG